MSEAPAPVFIDIPEDEYRWIDLHGVAMEVRPPDSISMAYARGRAAKVEAQIQSGLDEAFDWANLSADDLEEEQSRKEVRELVLAVKLAKRIGRRWNATFTRGSLEVAPFDEEHLRKLFMIPRMMDAFWFHVLAMGPTIDLAEGNDFAAGPSGDMDSAAKPADSAPSKERDAPLEAETASQTSAAPKKRTRRTPK